MNDGTTRRELLRWTAAATALSTLPGCDGAVSFLWEELDPLPDSLDLTAGDTVSPEFHLLSRAAFGPRPGDVARVRAIGTQAWIDEQLTPDAIDDHLLEARVLQFESVNDEPHDLLSVRNQVIREHLDRATLLRAVHTKRQLNEVLVHFWMDHFSIDVGKRRCLETKPLDDRTVIRRHALGRFRDLVRASALSPAMLIYLDGQKNRKATADEQPNENYARELLELHTLGVKGGYTQHDVMEAARCLTGWTMGEKDDIGRAFAYITGKAYLDGKDTKIRRAFVPEFNAKWHDDDEKTVLGRRIPAGGGEQDLEDLLDIVCTHPATARYVSWKLCRRFVADEPSEELVESTVAEFTRTDGDIHAVVRHILVSEAFRSSTGARVKRPFRFVTSALRAVGAQSSASRAEISALERLGHVPHRYPTPDGYPDEPEPYMGTLLWRWNFALRLSGGSLGGTSVDLPELAKRAGLDPATASPADAAPLLLGRRATDEERRIVDDYVDRAAADGARAVGSEVRERLLQRGETEDDVERVVERRVARATEDGRRAARSEALALLIAGPAFQAH